MSDVPIIARERIFIMPQSGGVVAQLDDASRRFGAFVPINPLRDPLPPQRDSSIHRLIMYSGTLADGLFDAHPMTWLAPGHEALKQFCDAYRRRSPRERVRICFVPHSRHVLSDPQSCLTFLAGAESRNDSQGGTDKSFEIALAPQCLLERSMLSDIDDHLTRAFETIGRAASALLLHDCRAEGADDDALKAAPLGRGVLPRALVLQLINAHLPRNAPIILLDDQLDLQLAWLGVAGGAAIQNAQGHLSATRESG